MIAIIILSIVLPIVGFLFGILYQKYKTRKILTRGTGRFGIIETSYSSEHPFTIEIEEIEEAGLLTKVYVIRVVSKWGDGSNNNIYTDNFLLEKIGFKEWVPTSKIIWYNNNSQKLRENKINEILG